MDLISKYNQPVPRYTSYPPANFFATDYTSDIHIKQIKQSNSEGINTLSFYIHIPFCPKLCHYCACNAYPMEQRSNVEIYMNALLEEIELVTEHIDKSRPITQIHYGGGTPTAVPLHWLARINHKLMGLFPLAEGAEIAIECHPGYLSLKGWEELVKAGFNRVSIGVQDFHPDVLKAVNRQESREAFEDIFSLLRKHNIQINLDLIYGLPLQTIESFRENIKRAISLQPDRLVTFSYAHVPWVKEGQRILEILGLPEGNIKNQMFHEASKLLHQNAYHSVGLDHFVRANDPLYLAKEKGLLHRNFQGYCTRATTGQVYAFGVSAISQLSGAFAQNTKDIPRYIEVITKNKALAIERGYKLKRNEQIAGEIIAAIMCNGKVLWEDIAKTLGVSIAELMIEQYQNKPLLDELINDRLITMDGLGVIVTQEGERFIRIIASAFDPLMQNKSSKNTYSLAL